jgi:hypothetical protein
MVTRGFGRNPPGQVGLLTFGLAKGFIEDVTRIIKAGQSGAKRALQELQEVIVGVRLIRINDAPPPKKIQGFVRVRVNLAARAAITAAQYVSSRVKSVFEDIKITIKRIK